MVSIPVADGLLLRSYEPADATELFHAISESRVHLRKWLMWVDQTTKPEYCQQFIAQAQQQMHDQEGMALGIFEGDKIIGGIGMHHWEHVTKKAQIGYWISGQYEGKGIIHKSLSLFIGFLFNNVGLNKIEIHYDPANKRSAAVAKKLGFATEGYLRQSVLRNGRLEDMIVTGLLKSEWQSNQ
jgi:ribosomal-protein-serine acetyltransferase